jgi:hypothetical protein
MAEQDLTTNLYSGFETFLADNISLSGNLTFGGDNMVFSISNTGQITLGEGVSLDAASARFWLFVAQNGPYQQMAEFLRACQDLRAMLHDNIFNSPARKTIYDRFEQQLAELEKATGTANPK